MNFDMNDAQPQVTGELIPDGTYAKVAMHIRKGGVDGAGDLDKGLLKPSNQPGSDVLSLDAEFTVLEGPHARRKFWQSFTVLRRHRDRARSDDRVPEPTCLGHLVDFRSRASATASRCPADHHPRRQRCFWCRAEGR